MSSYSTETSRRADVGRAEVGARSGSSIGLIVPTLLKNMIGAGIFSLPVGLRHASPIPGLIVLGTIGLLSASSYWMIGYCCISCNVKSFRDLWNMVLGPRSAWIIDVTIFLNGWITLICYIILIGDFTTKSFEGLLGADHVLARNRAANQTVITAFVLLPLSLAKDLQRLAYTSILGLGVLVYVLFVVIHDSILNSPPEISQDVPLCHWNFGIFEAIALYCHAFVAHYNAPKVFSELANPTLSRWTVLVGIAYSVAFLVYAEFAWAGFRRFEWSVEGNVLKNYGPQLNILIAWLGMGFSIAFTYPLVFNSAREAAINLTLMARQSSLPLLRQVMNSPRFQELHSGYSGSSWQRRTLQLIGLLGPSPDSPNHKLSQKPGTKTTFLLVFLTYAVAINCEDVGVVNALAGSIMGCMVCLVLPGLLFFNTARMQRRSMKGRGLQEALLPKGLSMVTTCKSTLLLAQFAGMLIFLCGLVFTIVGTVVILLHHWS